MRSVSRRTPAADRASQSSSGSKIQVYWPSAIIAPVAGAERPAYIELPTDFDHRPSAAMAD